MRIGWILAIAVLSLAMGASMAQAQFERSPTDVDAYPSGAYGTFSTTPSAVGGTVYTAPSGTGGTPYTTYYAGPSGGTNEWNGAPTAESSPATPSYNPGYTPVYYGTGCYGAGWGRGWWGWRYYGGYRW